MPAVLAWLRKIPGKVYAGLAAALAVLLGVLAYKRKAALLEQAEQEAAAAKSQAAAAVVRADIIVAAEEKKAAVVLEHAAVVDKIEDKRDIEVARLEEARIPANTPAEEVEVAWNATFSKRKDKP
jgi:hypothetical protein